MIFVSFARSLKMCLSVSVVYETPEKTVSSHTQMAARSI